MYTLQILDQGQTFLFTLASGQPVALGSTRDAELRLRAEGVAPLHARIEWSGDAPHLVASGEATLTVNGRRARRAPLVLGDRIEIGGAVVVVGKTVPRPARPEDVLDPGRAGARPRARQRRWVPVTAGLLATLGLVAVIVQSGGGVALPSGFHEIDRLRRAGSFGLAREQIASLQAKWAQGDPARVEVLAAESAKVAELEALVDSRRQSILERAAQTTYAQFSTELQQEEQSSNPALRQAARIVRASLSDLLRDAGRPSLPAPVVAEQPEPTAVPGPPVDPPAAAPEPAIAVTTAAEELPAALQDVDRLRGSGMFRQALEALDGLLASSPADAGALLQQQRADTVASARAAHDDLVARARATAAGGGLAGAIVELANAEHRFPTRAGFEALPALLANLRAQQAAADALAKSSPQPAPPAVTEATRQVTLASLQELLEQIRQGEAAGDFAGTERLLRRGAELVADRDPDFAQRLLARAADFALIGELHARTAELLASGKRIDVALRSGGKAVLHGADDRALLATTPDGEQRLPWFDLAAPGVEAVVQGGKLGGNAVLGAATLLYKLGDAPAAEALLARALKADLKLKPGIDQALARGRGEPLDPRGYTLTKDGFVAAAAIDAEKASQKLLSRLDSVLRSRDPKVRQAFLAEALGQGPSALAPVVTAFSRELQQQIDQLEGSSLKQQVERVAVQRQQLDEARAHAKELIFDEVRYFYPYKPPQVSPDRYAEYMRVQAEVDRRVAAVRALWQDDRYRIKPPASLQEALARLDWLAAVLADLGKLDPAVLAQIEWARALPPGGTVGIQNYCRTVQERQELELWQRIQAYNQQIAARTSVVEREQLQITNDYRAMFRHRPLALNLEVAAAAHGHAEEMSTLGYFSHFSPTPGRRTPFDRMKLAGYDFGVSENIATSDSAASAHGAWCRSSGHHRNLLSPSHTEFGIGALDRYWVQNFGQGKEYERDAVWLSGANGR